MVLQCTNRPREDMVCLVIIKTKLYSLSINVEIKLPCYLFKENSLNIDSFEN